MNVSCASYNSTLFCMFTTRPCLRLLNLKIEIENGLHVFVHIFARVRVYSNTGAISIINTPRFVLQNVNESLHTRLSIARAYANKMTLSLSVVLRRVCVRMLGQQHVCSHLEHKNTHTHSHPTNPSCHRSLLCATECTCCIYLCHDMCRESNIEQ